MTGSKRFVMVIGAMRTGTGWTYNYFRSHDSIYCPALKEWHFFDARHNPEARPGLEKHLARRLSRTVARLAKGRGNDTQRKHDWELVRDGAERLRMGDNIEAYRDFFLRNAGDKEIVADITPNYATLDRNAFREMNALSDDVRFIFIIRNPADRAWSQICKAKPHAADRKVAKSFVAALGKDKVVVKTDYRRTIEELYAGVPAGRVHIQLFEELFTPDAVTRLCEFLEVPYREPNLEPNRRPPKNKKRILKPKLRLRAVKHYRNVYEHFAGVYGDRLPSSWRADIAALERREMLLRRGARRAEARLAQAAQFTPEMEH